MSKLEAVFIQWFTIEELTPINGKKVLVQDKENNIHYCTVFYSYNYTELTFHNDYTDPLKVDSIKYWTYGKANDIKGIKDE